MSRIKKKHLKKKLFSVQCMVDQFITGDVTCFDNVINIF